MSKMANSEDKQEQPNDPMYYVQFGYLLNRTIMFQGIPDVDIETTARR